MITELLNLELIMIVMILAGVLLRRLGRITDAGRESLTNIVLDVIIPCNIVVSFLGSQGTEELLRSLPAVALSVINMIMLAAAGFIFFRGSRSGSAIPARYGLITSNAIFIGLPVVQSLLGDKGVMIQSIYMVFVRCITWTYGISIFSVKEIDPKKILKQLMTNPCMLAVYVGIFLMVTGIRIPNAAERILRYFSNCLMAMSMLLIGVVLYGTDLKAVFRKDIWWFCLIRLAVAPAAALGVCLILHTDPTISAVSVLMMGMPAASLTAVLAARYQNDLQYASLIVAASTILSIITIPVWYYILQLIYAV